jgi:hypothetical protein
MSLRCHPVGLRASQMCAGGREGLCCSRLGSEVREDTVGRRGPLLGCEFKAMELQGLSSVDPSCAATQEKRLRSRIPGSTRDRPGQPTGPRSTLALGG